MTGLLGRLTGRAARDVPGLERGERLLARAATDTGEVVVTDRALLLRQAGTERRWEWPALASATWEDDTGTLTVVPMAEPADVHLTLPDPGRVPEAVRERLTASIVVSTHVALAGPAGVRILARRRPGQDGLVWQLRFDRDVDAAHPDVRRRAEEALADVRARTGG